MKFSIQCGTAAVAAVCLAVATVSCQKPGDISGCERAAEAKGRRDPALLADSTSLVRLGLLALTCDSLAKSLRVLSYVRDSTSTQIEYGGLAGTVGGGGQVTIDRSGSLRIEKRFQ
jgi:hypothetical protein